MSELLQRREKIEQGVVNMFKVNMGVKSGEKLLVIADVTTTEEWVEKESKELAEKVYEIRKDSSSPLAQK